MALQDSGSIPPIVSMSLLDINVELGESPTELIDFLGAATSFSGILDDGQVEILEFYNKTFSVGTGPYGARSLHTFRFINDSGTEQGWQDGELVSAAENTTNGLPGSYAIQEETDYVGFEVDDGQLTNGDIIYENSTGVTLTNLRPGGDFTAGTHFLLDTDADKLFQINSSAVVSNLTDRTPDTPDAPTLSSRTGNSITVDVAADTIVTRQLVPVLDGVDQTAILPSASGSIGNTDVTTQHTFTGLNSGQTYVLGFKAKNNFATTAQGATLSQATTAATTWTNNTSSIALQIDTAKSGQQDTFVRPSTSGDPASIIVNNHNGNTSISVTQASYFPGLGQLQIAVSILGDPGSAGDDNSGTGWATSHTGIDNELGATIYYRIRHQDIVNNTETDPVNQTETITFTNNGVSETVSVPYRIQQNS